MLHARRHLACAAILAGALSFSVHPTHTPAQAAGLTTYRSAADHFSLQYPSAWVKIPEKDKHFRIDSPDGLASIVVFTFPQPTPLTIADLQQVASNEIFGEDAKARAVKFGTRTVHGVTFALGTAQVKLQGTVYEDYDLTIRHGKRLLVFSGGWPLGGSTTSLLSAQVTQTLGSISFTK